MIHRYTQIPQNQDFYQNNKRNSLCPNLNISKNLLLDFFFNNVDQLHIFYIFFKFRLQTRKFQHLLYFISHILSNLYNNGILFLNVQVFT